MSDLLSVVGPWMRGRRWYQAKGAAASGGADVPPRLVAELALPAAAPVPSADPVRRTLLPRRRDAPARGGGTGDDAESRILLVEDAAGGTPILYQVPVVLRSAPRAGAEDALIGLATVAGRRRLVYDGPQDPAFTEALLAALLADGEITADGGAPDDGTALAATVVDARDVVAPMTGRVLRGEQSNTSIILEPSASAPAGSLPVIAKVFRVLAEGTNPDVEVQVALAREGSAHVARPVASLAVTWTDQGSPTGAAGTGTAVTGTAVTGTAVFAQEFLAGTEDAWRVALRACAEDEDFAEDARALGRATAEVHRDLARAMPVEEVDAAEVAEGVAAMLDRLEAAVAEVPELAPSRDRLAQLLGAAAGVAWPARQRIHGDYHLGQVLAVADERAWVLLDFEGEPLKPLSERTRPDQPLRDVAGMLRSFDYVAGAVRREMPDVLPARATGWALRAREAFRAGYDEVAGTAGPDDPSERADAAPTAAILLAAFEADKAVYEVVYEARNRPDWLDIPLGGIDRILASAPEG
jgi:trehalose synthase-fused probable maltokinase